MVVTGIGAVTGRARDAAGLWATRFSVPLDAGTIALDPGLLRTPPRWGDIAARAAVDAVAEAWAQAGLAGPFVSRPTPRYQDRIGVVLGVGLGGLRAGERVTAAAAAGRESRPRDVLSLSPAEPVAAVARWVGATGPCRGVASACASGTDAIAEAARLIAGGVCDVVVAGACDAGATAANIAGLRRLGVLSATGRSRPFDTDRDGLVLAEAAAVLVLEATGTARRRGAVPLARVLGGAARRNDGGHSAAPAPDGATVTACIRAASADAGIGVADLVALTAHATGTAVGDEAEASGLRRTMTNCAVPITAGKAATGHAMAAAGALDAVTTVLALNDGRMPPVVGFQRAAPGSAAADLDLVTEPRTLADGPVATVAAGFGGFTAVLVLAPA